MIQDLGPDRLDNAYHPYAARPQDKLLIFRNDQVMLLRSDPLRLGDEETIAVPNCSLPGVDRDAARFLFEQSGARYFFVDGIADDAVPPEAFWLSGVQFQQPLPKPLAFALATATHLHNWYARHRLCGRCGTPMRHSDTERAMICDSCKFTEYPRISPAVIIGVTDGDKLLLSHYTGRAYKRYALLAGFAEIGETIEETVRREVMEETGLTVDHLRYYKSQPWPYSESLLLGFYCDVTGSREIRCDQNELADAIWCPRDELPGENRDISLTEEMICVFKAGKEPR